MKTVTYFSGVCSNLVCANLIRTAIRTHQTTAGPDCELHFWDHGAETDTQKQLSSELRAECSALGVKYQYRTDPYHATKWMNEFARTTDSDAIVWATADCIFHPYWLLAMEDALDFSRHLHTLHPSTFDAVNLGLAYRGNYLPDSRVLPTDQPLCHVVYMLRSKGYVWDENFPFWEADMDYHCWLKAKRLNAGVVRNSIVDHLGGSTMRDSNLEVSKCDDRVAARRRLEAKWKLPRIEY